MTAPIHVVPINDRYANIDNGDPCPCLPMVTREGVVRHNAYDAREVGEVCRKALDLLGVAHRPPWTDEEREAYEHAIHVLDMHWPKDDGEKNGRGTGFPFRPQANGNRCAVCGRCAPLVDDECPDCRH